jgi:L-iditol 2-dehydrogenase
MRAAVYYNNRDIRLEERPKPKAGPGELVVRIDASGVCGSDVMEWYRLPKAPLVLGHEISGEVVDVGPGVARFSAGDRVVATHHVPCNTCPYCMAGHHPYCDTLRTTHFDPGGFCEFVRLPAINVDRGTLRLPDGVSFEEATFVEPLACVLRALRVARFAPTQSVAVLGSGISGSLFVLALRALGAGPVLATDLQPWRLEKIQALGADAALDAGGDVPGEVRGRLGGRGANLVVVTTAALPAVAQALRSVDRGGTVLFFAPAEPGTSFPLPLFDVWKDGVSLVHSYAGPPADMAAALDLIGARRVDVAATITHRLPLAQTAAAFDLVARAGESLKVIVNPCR